MSGVRVLTVYSIHFKKLPTLTKLPRLTKLHNLTKLPMLAYAYKVVYA